MPADAPAPKPICFVVSPIGDPSSEIRRRADQLIRFVINPVLADKYEVIRADHITVPGSINRQVFDRLLNAALVVADLTGHNPNVFYELAVRHAAAKPFIQVIDSKERLPFDVFDQRTIKFDIHDLDSVEDAKKQLAAHEHAITAPGFRVETPIGEAILQSAAIANGSDETKVVMQALDQVQKRLGLIEQTVRSSPYAQVFDKRAIFQLLEKQGGPLSEKALDELLRRNPKGLEEEVSPGEYVATLKRPTRP